jgi:hypothetical protein
MTLESSKSSLRILARLTPRHYSVSECVLLVQLSFVWGAADGRFLKGAGRPSGTVWCTGWVSH